MTILQKDASADRGSTSLIESDAVVSVAVVRRSGHILLIKETLTHEPYTAWTVPGGPALPAELAVDALVRTVCASTGLQIVRVGRLISVVQIGYHARAAAASNAGEPQRSTVLLFEAAEWRGELPDWHPGDGSGEACFWNIADALELLAAHPSAALSEPVMAYLRGESTEGAWIYRRGDDGHELLVWPPREIPPEVEERVRRARALVAVGCLAVLVILILIVIIGIITIARPFA